MEDSTSESEDERAVLLTKKVDRKIQETIDAIRRKDKRVYDSNVKFFEEEKAENGRGNGGGGDGEGDENGEEEKDEEDDGDDEEVLSSGDEPVAGWSEDDVEEVKKTMTIHDMMREQALKTGRVGESSSDDDDHYDDHGDDIPGSDVRQMARRRSEVRAYDDEQRALRDAVTKNGEEDGGKDSRNDDDEEDEEAEEDDFFVKKTRTKEEVEMEEEEYGRFVVERNRKLGAQKGEEYLLHTYMEKESLDDKERFLHEFVMNNGWLDRNKTTAPKAFEYEIEVDRPKSNRKGGEGEETVAVDEDEKFLDAQEETERRHNFRFEEEGADQIVSYGRSTGEASLRRKEDRRKRQREAKKERKEKDRAKKLEEVKRLKNFKKAEIQDKLDRLQATSGGVDFAEFDLEGDFDPEEFSRQMAAKFGEEYYDVQGGEVLEHPFQNEAIEDDEGDDVARDEAEEQAKIQSLVDDYYTIGMADVDKNDHDMMPKFRYKAVEPMTGGLTVDEILQLDDKQLNKRVPLKRLAPYRTDKFNARKFKYSQAYWQKQRVNSRGNGSGSYHRKDNHSSNTFAVNRYDNDHNSRRKRRHPPEVQLSDNRARAYGATRD